MTAALTVLFMHFKVLEFELRCLSLNVQRYGSENEMVKLDKEQQVVTLKNGQQIHYDALITTTPLDITLSWLGKKDWAERLNHRYRYW